MMIAGGNECASVQDAVTGDCFLYLDRAILIESIGEGAGEYLRHMLNDHDTGAVWLQSDEHFADSFGASGGGADRDNFVGCDLDGRCFAFRENGVGRKSSRYRNRCRRTHLRIRPTPDRIEQR